MQQLVSTDLYELNQALRGESSFEDRLQRLKEFPLIEEFLVDHPKWGEGLEESERYVLLSLVATGQERLVLGARDLGLLASQLLPVERFYAEMGGVLGYHLTCLDLLRKKDQVEKKGIYHAPKARDISACTEEIQSYILEGLAHLPEMAEIYPVGGAADRLSLRNEETGAFQIAATLPFAKKTLLERLIEDLIAREYLYEKVFGKRVSIPVVLMSSAEKNGTEHLRKHLEEKNWFGKSEEDFFLFAQPLVPTMTSDGKWQMKSGSELLLKPGGHGVIWKLARERGALEWLKKKGRRKAFVRQINNIMAGVDYGVLAFLGVGAREDKKFGFAACPRLEGVSEGVNVVIETKEGFSLTNIEYCDLKHFQVEEENLLANTNLLYVDLAAIESLIKKCPIPGMLVNAKKMQVQDVSGVASEKEILRLESTMQNIADALVEETMLKNTYITMGERRKTISPIKKEFAFGSSMLQTPEQCYLDLLENARDLLENFCGFEVPGPRPPLSFFSNGPSFIFLYHPALGPQYEIIQQKLRGGRLAMGAELILEIAEIDVENLQVDGSLEVKASDIRSGSCTLKNVTVQNGGIHREASRSFWKDEIIHNEKCEIFIEEGGELFAEDVTLQGELRFYVPSGTRLTLSMSSEDLKIEQEEIAHPTWAWEYAANGAIDLTKKSR